MPNILVVEDNALELEKICEVLEARGYSTRGASTVLGAQQELNESSFSVAVVDMKLPVTDQRHVDPLGGKTVLEYCRKIQPLVKCVILTSKGDRNEAERVIQCLEAGAFKWVYKGTGFEYLSELLAKVQEALNYFTDQHGLTHLRQLYGSTAGCPLIGNDSRCALMSEILNAKNGMGYSDKKVFLAIPYDDYHDRESAINSN